MKNKLSIGIDFDQTICESGISLDHYCWVDYLNNASSRYNSKEWFLSLSEINYNLGSYYPDLPEDEAFYFWRDANLYQKMKPYPEAVEVINQLAKEGHNIVFISHCQVGHFKSKVLATKQWFDIPEKQYCFLATREKHFADIDVLIDDRNKFHNLFKNKPEVIKILFDTPYTQDEELEVSIDLRTKDWYDIGKFLKEVL